MLFKIFVCLFVSVNSRNGWTDFEELMVDSKTVKVPALKLKTVDIRSYAYKHATCNLKNCYFFSFFYCYQWECIRFIIIFVHCPSDVNISLNNWFRKYTVRELLIIDLFSVLLIFCYIMTLVNTAFSDDFFVCVGHSLLQKKNILFQLLLVFSLQLYIIFYLGCVFNSYSAYILAPVMALTVSSGKKCGNLPYSNLFK